MATSSDEEEQPKKPRKKKKGKKAVAEPEPLPLDSDVEEGNLDGEDDEEAVDTKWGKKRSNYYNADYVDEDWDGESHYF